MNAAILLACLSLDPALAGPCEGGVCKIARAAKRTTKVVVGVPVRVAASSVRVTTTTVRTAAHRAFVGKKPVRGFLHRLFHRR